MSAKHCLKITACAALVLLWQGTIPRATAQEKQDKQKTQANRSSIQVPPSEKDEAKLQAAAKITAEDAKNAAVKKHPRSPVKYVKIRNLKGSLVYEVEFQDDQEYMVDAGNGEVLAKGQEGKKK